MADILKRTNVENKDFNFTADDVNELIDAINLSYNNSGETSIYQWSDNLVYNPYFSIDYEGRNQYDNTKEDGIHILNGYWNGTSGWTNFSRGNRKDFETCIIDNTKMLHFTKVGTEELIIPSGVRPSTDYGMENVRIPVCDYSGDSCNVIKISFDYISPSNKQFVFVCKSVEGNIIKSCKVLKFYTNNIETKYETIYFRDGEYILLPSVATKTKIEIFFEGAKSTTINAPIYNYEQIGIFALRDKENDDYEQTFADSWYNREFYFGNPCINLLSFTKDKNKNILNKSNEELNYIKNQLNSHINNNLVHLKRDGEGNKLLTDNGSYSDNYYNKKDIDDLLSKINTDGLGVDFSCTELPTEDIKEKTIYFIPNGETEEKNIYTEYIYNNNQWEIIGSLNTEVDLSDYYTKTEIDTTLEDYCKTTEVDEKIEQDMAKILIPNENLLNNTNFNRINSYYDVLFKFLEQFSCVNSLKRYNYDECIYFTSSIEGSGYYGMKISKVKLAPSKNYTLGFKSDGDSVNNTLNYFKIIDSDNVEHDLTLMDEFNVERNYIKIDTSNYAISNNYCTVDIIIGYNGDNLTTSNNFDISKIKLGYGNVRDGYSKGLNDIESNNLYKSTITYWYQNTLEGYTDFTGNCFKAYNTSITPKDINKIIIVNGDSSSTYNNYSGSHIIFPEGYFLYEKVRVRLTGKKESYKLYFWELTTDTEGNTSYSLITNISDKDYESNIEYILYYEWEGGTSSPFWKFTPIYKLYQDIDFNNRTKNIKLYDSSNNEQIFEIGKTTFNDTTTDIATMLHHKRDYASVIGYQQPEDSSYAYGSYIVFDKYNKLKRTYGDTYTVEFRQPTIFNEDVKFLGTVEGTINSVPTGCYSKTEVNNKFLALGGNTKDTAMSGEIYLANGKGLYGLDTNGNPVRLAVHSNGTNYFGVKECTSMIRSSNNPQVMVGDKTYTMYHTGNVPKYIWSGGDKTAETGTNAPDAGHLAMNTIYNNGYPCTYGNLLTLSGSGKSELAMEWSGNAVPTTGRLYYRSKRDADGTAWGAWKKIAYTDDTVGGAKTLVPCAYTSDTGNSNTNKYFKLATFNLNNNYASFSGEYNIGFWGHGMNVSYHHKLGVWIKRQDSTFSMDLKVWGALNDNYATYILVKTGQYQATLYAFLRIQYCRAYMTCLGRNSNNTSVTYYEGTDPITTVGTTNVYGTLMDKPSTIGANTTLFSGYLKGDTITNSSDTSTIPINKANINKNNCFTGDYFTAPETGCYLFTGNYNVDSTSITKNGIARLWIQVETSSGTYVDGASAINMNLETNVYKNYNYTRHLYIEKGNKVKFYHNVTNGATYTFGSSGLTIIKLN